MSPSVHVTRANELDSATGQTDGMMRQGAITGKSNKMCSLVMTAEAHTASAIHHHGEQDTIIYSLRGHGSLVFDGGSKRQDLAPGDFALIPAQTEHQEVNESGEQVTWIIIRSGKSPVTVNIEGWSST